MANIKDLLTHGDGVGDDKRMNKSIRNLYITSS